MDESNPYASPTPLKFEPGIFMLGGNRSARGLLHRTIAFTEPFQTVLDYDGKHFRQRVLIGGHRVWHCISWVRIHPKIEFVWPAEIAGSDAPGRIEMRFNRLLWIKRFVIYLNDRVIYDENNDGG
ncbi:MAG: hypothetical protein R3C05_15960 [Pirellulaceae bacterium]